MSTLTSSQPEIITCRTTADFLAALPLLVGYTAPNSIFLVLFRGKRTGHTVRIDLPADESPAQTAPLLDFISDLLQQLIDPSEIRPLVPAIVITTEQDIPPNGPVPWQRLARRLERRLQRDGFELRELCCLAANSWSRYAGAASPAGTRPLSEIEQSAIGQRYREARQRIQPLAQMGRVPSAHPVRAAAIAAALASLPKYDTPRASPAPSSWRGTDNVPKFPVPGDDACVPSPWLQETAEACHELRRLDRQQTAEQMHPEAAARLIRTAEHSDRWIALLLGILTRPEFPGELSLDPSMPHSFEGLPIDIDHGAHPRPVDGWSVRRLMLAVCPEFEQLDRLHPILELLPVIIADTPVQLRPGLFSLSAAMWWLVGSQTVAERHVRSALTIDPQHELSLMVERVVRVPLTKSLTRALRQVA